MRNLFFVLVLANLAFAAWHSWFSKASGTQGDNGDVPTIMLASEFPVAADDVAAPAIVEAEIESLATTIPATDPGAEGAAPDEAANATEELQGEAAAELPAEDGGVEVAPPAEAEVEGAGVGRAIFTDQAGAVDGEQHVQLLQRDIVDQLVVAALQEGGINGDDGLHAVAGEAGS